MKRYLLPLAALALALPACTSTSTPGNAQARLNYTPGSDTAAHAANTGPINRFGQFYHFGSEEAYERAGGDGEHFQFSSER